MKKLVISLFSKNKVFAKTLFLVSKLFLSEQDQIVLLWKLSDGDNTLRLNYKLTKNSIVFDVGGYVGEWSEEIYKKYECEIYIFEPVPTFVKRIDKRLKNKKKIHIYPFGLSNKTKTTRIYLAENATSSYASSPKTQLVKMVNINDVIKKYKLNSIDLIKLNIEGDEYDLLEHMIKTGTIKTLKNIQVQLHPFVPNATTRVQNLRESLRKTHRLTYQFPFVWENWTRKTKLDTIF